jgi:transposase
MNLHSNARLTPYSREQIVRRWEAGERPEAIAEAMGVSSTTVRKWIERYETEGLDGLQDRSSRPRTLRNPTPSDRTLEVEDLRRTRLPMWKIAMLTGLSQSTVSRICARAGLSRLKDLDPKPEIIRYEKDSPGELIHIDTKKLGRIDGIGHRITGNRKGQSNKHGTGWEVLHQAVACPGLDPGQATAWPTPKSCPTKRACPA